MSVLHIKCGNISKSLEITGEIPISKFLQKAGIPLDTRCSGNGTCGKCEVIVTKGSFLRDGKLFQAVEEKPLRAPSCKIFAGGDELDLTVPSSSCFDTGVRICDEFMLPEHRFAPPSGTTTLGAAVDIGTTTVAIVLVDMKTGEVISRASAPNHQISVADDVTSRISAASGGLEMLKELQSLIIESTINPLLHELCRKARRKVSEIERMTVSGNTVMCHIFLGLSPETIGVLPFKPLMNFYPETSAKSLKLSMSESGTVDTIPSISGYLGGDAVVGIYISRIMKSAKSALFIDLGTNAETVLCDSGKLFGCAAAAGPAFEGSGILCGSRAVAGAIERIHFDSSLDFNISTIENAPPSGICGSAIIDFLACGFRSGLINEMGRFNIELLKKKNRYYSFTTSTNRITHSCLLMDKKNAACEYPLMITEADIESALKAKAAVYAAIKTLLSSKGRRMEEISQLFLAGGFARYINIENAVSIGMLPECLIEKIVLLGNSSLGGAYLALTDSDARESFDSIVGKPETVSLNLIPDFETNFIDALMLPNFNKEEFPMTLKNLNARILQ
ncbi:MAG: hypothetical protein A2020_11785 [Lentisphaerae bacterium GWF2_45_14]|nr:MAG: hypothetical protein A2020_11785 [Lentisphaerae bacterium GWF2_45_14]